MDWANDPGDEGDNHEHDREGEVAMDEGDEDEDGGDENDDSDCDDSTMLLLSVRLEQGLAWVSDSGKDFLASWGVGTIDVFLIGLE
ncbi:hypothetical protein BGZ59_008949, partial [Podila verticillata]